MQLDKPYIDAQAAAVMLGTNRETVIADIERGIAGQDFMALSGGRVGYFWLVERWELVGDRLEIHRGRFATGKCRTDGSSGSRE